MRKHQTGSASIQIKPPMLYDRYLLFTTLFILAIGLLMVASASMVISESQYGTAFHYLYRQGLFVIVSLVVGGLVFRVPIKTFKQYSPVLLILSIFLLILVLIPGIGHQVNGSRRWISLGFMSLQVSEIAKLGVILYIANYIVRFHEEIQENLSGFIKPMFIVGILSLLLLKEPDFGATVVITVTTMAMLYLAGVRVKVFVIIAGMIVVALALLAVASPYRLARLTTFIDPWANQYDSGYQLTQSLIAFGRGGWFGVGLGASIQKLFYLPEAHTDFLFAVLGEELGLVGELLVLGLYTLLLYRIFKISKQGLDGKRYYNAYVALGAGMWLGLQTLINIGVNTGILPTKGLTLPLMSYGGSSLLVNVIMIAIVLRIDYEQRREFYGI